MVAQLARLGDTLDAIVVTGDVTDLGEADAYRRVRAAVEPLVDATGADLIWVMGNHDERGPFREGLLDEAPSDEPVHRVLHVGGLRVVALDTSVPGYHHGELDATSLAWLAEVLAEPAAEGTILAMHHAPLPTPLALMDLLELRGQEELADVIRGRDVRLILGGHLHYATNGTFAGVPVSVAGATAYTMDLSAPPRELVGIDGGRSFTLVHLYDDTFVTSVVPGRAVPRRHELRGGVPRRGRGALTRGTPRALLAQAPSRSVSTGCAARARPTASQRRRGGRLEP